jgi:hypothetical protein
MAQLLTFYDMRMLLASDDFLKSLEYAFKCYLGNK